MISFATCSLKLCGAREENRTPGTVTEMASILDKKSAFEVSYILLNNKYYLSLHNTINKSKGFITNICHHTS
jgi:hypothetical protein